jgi:crossover junction endodeoxyribonuclease RuvC
VTIILGIDPGLRITGYGVIKSARGKSQYLTSGRIITQGKDLTARLGQIFSGITQVIQEYNPTHTAVEQVFVKDNIATALKLGQARGAALAAVAAYKLKVAEYTPRHIKQAIVGFGAADKTQVQYMVQCLLQLTGLPAVDAADALAAALCHASHSRLERMF